MTEASGHRHPLTNTDPEVDLHVEVDDARGPFPDPDFAFEVYNLATANASEFSFVLNPSAYRLYLRRPC